MKKKVLRVGEGSKSSILHYEDGTSEQLPDGIFVSFTGQEKALSDEEKESFDKKPDNLMKAYKKQKLGDL